jgi:hypothetical protein
MRIDSKKGAVRSAPKPTSRAVRANA